MTRHILDENIRRSQAALVRAKISSVSQVGVDWGAAGWDDTDQIIPHLHGSGATFHTQDEDFFDWRLWHPDYSLVYYDVLPGEVSHWIVAFLRHARFQTHADRLGKVIHVTPQGITFWQRHDHQLHSVSW